MDHGRWEKTLRRKSLYPLISKNLIYFKINATTQLCHLLKETRADRSSSLTGNAETQRILKLFLKNDNQKLKK